MLSKGIEKIDKVKSVANPSGASWLLAGDERARSTGGARRTRQPDRLRAGKARYQACWARQCGQQTVVETGARKTKPHAQA